MAALAPYAILHGPSTNTLLSVLIIPNQCEPEKPNDNCVRKGIL